MCGQYIDMCALLLFASISSARSGHFKCRIEYLKGAYTDRRLKGKEQQQQQQKQAMIQQLQLL